MLGMQNKNDCEGEQTHGNKQEAQPNQIQVETNGKTLEWVQKLIKMNSLLNADNIILLVDIKK